MPRVVLLRASESIMSKLRISSSQASFEIWSNDFFETPAAAAAGRPCGGTRASYFQCEARTIFPFCLMSWQLGFWLQQLLGDIPANNVQTWHCDYVPVSSRLESCTTGTLLRTLSHIQTIICRQHNTVHDTIQTIYLYDDDDDVLIIKS